MYYPSVFSLAFSPPNHYHPGNMIERILRIVGVVLLALLSGLTAIGLISAQQNSKIPEGIQPYHQTNNTFQGTDAPSSTTSGTKSNKEMVLQILYPLMAQKFSEQQKQEGQNTDIDNITNTTEKSEQQKQPIVYTATAVLGGDIMLSRTIGYQNRKSDYNKMQQESTYHPLQNIASCGQGECLILANLESPFSPNDNDINESNMIFRANTGNISILQWLRQGQLNTTTIPNTLVLSLANNHTNNAGGQGMLTTPPLLNENNILHVGAGTTKEDANKILTFTHNNINWCIGAYSYDGNGGRYGGKPLYRNAMNLSGMLADLSTMNSQLRCDIKAMMVHWGSEYRINPNKSQINIAHTLVDNGLDVLIGGHSHIPGKIEQYNGKYIFYSLGNFLFDQDRGMRSVLAGMDTIYDATLKKTTVPTYISILPEVYITKTISSGGTTTLSGQEQGYWSQATTGNNISSTISITIKKLHTARIEKGLFKENDKETEHNIFNKILPEVVLQ